jgi:aminoglycoside phosphotransferase (APT) family kinase protein
MSQDTSPATRTVDSRHVFDVGRLADWMQRTVGPVTAPLRVEQFSGGQSNPTFLVEHGAERFVLRRKPPGVLLPSAHAVEREYRVMHALADTDVPVPRMLALCEDPEVIGTPFYLMQHVAGRVFWNPALPELSREERVVVHDEVNRVIAALHNVDPIAVGLAGFGKPDQYIARQVARWSKQYEASATETIEAMDRLIEWLPRHVPAGEQTAIVHGDFRLDNLIFHPQQPRVLAVIDWELATLGHPLVDFANHCMTWRIPAGVFRGLADLDLATLGVPGEAEYVQTYCRRTGRDAVPAADWEYYMAYNLFRLAAIAQGITARALQGNASSAHALEVGRSTRPLADLAWRHVERLGRT